LSYLLSDKRPLMHSDLRKRIDTLVARLSLFGSKPPAANSFAKKFDAIFVTTDHCAKNYSGKEDYIETLIDSIIEQKTCMVAY
jgi:hypothetical protein